MKRYRKPKYPKTLPPVPVTDKMRANVIKYAKKENMSLAEIQRQALSLFLSDNYSDAIDTISVAIKREETECQN